MTGSNNRHPDVGARWAKNPAVDFRGGPRFVTSTATMTQVFIENFRRFCAGEPLVNVVDKRLGFVPR